jgi:predicted porin
MRSLRIVLLGSSLAFCAVARAVYAPIPDVEKGRGLTLSLEAGVTYNNNIFGAASGAIASMVYEVSPKIAFNSSLDPQTFFSASFQPRLDYFDNRPGTKDLYSQDLDARIAHSFSPTSVVDVVDEYAYDQNPQVLLNGVPVNTNQTLESNQFNAKYTFSPAERLGLALKTRIMYYDYIDDVIGDELNRFENLYGLEADYSLLPELKLAGEYRHLDVDYRNDPSDNDKHSDFLMAGFDYKVGPKLTASFRVGGEYTHRDSLSTETTPYVEFAGKYDYAKDSFISAGYTYDLEETSNPVLFSDEKTNRMFVNIQHAFTGLIVGSASFDYEPATLLGRAGQPNIEEDTTHAGAALTYLPNPKWRVSLTYDYDYVDSGISSRGLNRSQVGVRATVIF